MPLRTLTRFRNPDLTSDLNHRLRDLVTKGVFFGGQVLPVAGTLDVSVPNFASMGNDGMVTLLEGAAETLTCTPGVTQWILLKAYYVGNDAAVAELEVLGVTAYNALSTIEKQQRVKLAQVVLGPTATEVTTADISFVEADQIDPVDRNSFRGNVEQETDLPDWTNPATGVTTQNRPHDIYFVQDEQIFYSWNVSGTPLWRPVISAAEEVALRDHKNNQDDGTVAPDFFDAVHVQVKHRESLDEGSASVKQHAANGTDFGTGNAFVDEALPVTVLHREDVTALAGAQQFQLTGTYYVGKGAIGTANTHFRLATYQQEKALLGSDRRPITILHVRRSDDTFELTPSGDADALGYYANPIIRMNFAATVDGNYTGNLSVYGRLERGAGTIAPGDESLDNTGIGFIRPAQDVPAVGTGFLSIPPATDDVQEALDQLDLVLSGVASGGSEATLKKIVDLVSLSGGPDPDELNWYGGTAASIAKTTIYGSDPVIQAASGLDLQFRVPSVSEEFRWYFDTTVAMTLTTELSLKRNLHLDVADATIKIESGIGGTVGGIEWNFNNPASEFASIKLDYDVRTTEGLRMFSAFPITYDAGSYHQWQTAATPHMYLSGSGLAIGTSFASPEAPLHVQHSTSSRARVDQNAGGHSALTLGMSGLELVVGAMDNTAKWTSALKFMSKDGAFTTETPKFLAAIVGRAAETYGFDTSGGMALDFFTTGIDPGANSVPQLAMSLEADKSAIFQNGLTVDAGVSWLKGVAAIGSASPLADFSFYITRTSNGATAQRNIHSYTLVDADASAIQTNIQTVNRSLVDTGETASDLRGFYSNLDKDNAGTLTAYFAYRSHSDVNGGVVTSLYDYLSGGQVTLGTVGTYYGFAAGAPAVTGGAITTHYGFHVANLTQATTNYGMRILGANPGWAVYVDSGSTFFGGNVGIGVSPATPLHVQDSDVAIAPVGGTMLTLERSGDAYLTILSSTNGGLLCGDAADADAGRLVYNHGTNQWRFLADGAQTMYVDTNRVHIAPGTSTGITPVADLVIDDTTQPSIGFHGATGGSIWWKGTSHSTTSAAFAEVNTFVNSGLSAWSIDFRLHDATASMQYAMRIGNFGNPNISTPPAYGAVWVNAILANTATIFGTTANLSISDAVATGTKSVAAGFISVTIGGATRYIQTYSS